MRHATNCKFHKIRENVASFQPKPRRCGSRNDLHSNIASLDSRLSPRLYYNLHRIARFDYTVRNTDRTDFKYGSATDSSRMRGHGRLGQDDIYATH